MRKIVMIGLFLAPISIPAIQIDNFTRPTTESSGPSLWFTTSDIPTLQSRMTDPAYSGYYSTFKGFVDSQLSSIATLDDDTLSRVAKAAALLQRLGVTPPNTYPTYAAVATNAILNINSRSSFNINPIQDSGRLQSMSEAYDMLRGTPELAAANSAVRSKIGQWASALNGSFEMLFHPTDNYSIKAGSALVTASLVMATDGSAGTWFNQGITWINGALGDRGTDGGWYKESGHYLNYSLNNLVSTAYQVKNVAGVDWFDNLRPFTDYALRARLPSGQFAPFEEGIAMVYPFDVLARQYPDIAPQMLWAWNNSNKNSDNYNVQQMPEVTRFLVFDGATTPQSPTMPPTQFIGANANTAVLRSDWSANAVEAIMITAPDYSSSSSISSRHNMQNPLDMTVYALGQMLIPTSSGGPQATESANRSYYLDPKSKNIPLVNGTAPYLTDTNSIQFKNKLDSHNETNMVNRYMDVSTMGSAGTYSTGKSVSRTLAMMDDSYFLVVDDFSGGSATTNVVAWHALGTRQVLTDSSAYQHVRWDTNGVALDLHSVANVGLALDLTTGYYVPAWLDERSIDCIQSRTSNKEVNSVLLTLLDPHASNAPSMTVASISAGNAAGMRITDGSGSKTNWVVAGSVGVTNAAGPIQAKGRLASVKADGSGLLAFGLVEGNWLEYEGDSLFSASTDLTISLTLQTNGFLADVSSNSTNSFDCVFSSLALADPSAQYSAFYNGTPLSSNQFSQTSSTLQFTGLSPDGSLWVVEIPEPVGLSLLSGLLLLPLTFRFLRKT